MDTLILGCTHYPFLSDTIQEVMGEGVKLISSDNETAREMSAILQQSGMLALGTEMPVHQFFCSGDPAMFKRIAQQWLGEQIELTPVVWQIPQIG